MVQCKIYILYIGWYQCRVGWVVIISLREKLILAKSCLNNATKPSHAPFSLEVARSMILFGFQNLFYADLGLKHFPILCGVGGPLLLHIMVENVALPNMYFWNFIKCQWER
jgi:hypothetical protein